VCEEEEPGVAALQAGSLVTRSAAVSGREELWAAALGHKAAGSPQFASG
jgi:hypothetical protein